MRIWEIDLMPKIDIAGALEVIGSRYPAPFDAACSGRQRRCLGDAAGLKQFGVNLTTLDPGAWSSQRHWHTVEDELVFVVEGELFLVTDEGDTVLRAGECAGFPAGQPNGHHLQNRSDRPARYLEVGGRHPDRDEAFYSDIDLHAIKGRARNPATDK
jgi:uncharacterized cupin superfamily protein